MSHHQYAENRKVCISVKDSVICRRVGLTLFVPYANITQIFYLLLTSRYRKKAGEFSVQEGCLVQVTYATNG